MHFIGVDVGASKFFVSYFSSGDREINIAGPFENIKTFNEFLGPYRNNCVVAIDAPSDYCLKLNPKRICEEQLGIAGCYVTPKRGGKMQGWMKSGLELFEFLKKNAGFMLANSMGNGNLIEVHPTLIFKKQFNPEVEPKRWIIQRSPANKKTQLGKNQRIEYLSRLFKNQNISKVRSLDYLDALISAYTAECYFGRKSIFIGDPLEGQMCFPE